MFARQLAERTATEVTGRRHEVTVTEAHQKDFEKIWRTAADRPYWCNGKDLLASLNRWLTSHDCRPVGADQISRKMRAEEVPDEMIEVLRTAEAMLTR